MDLELLLHNTKIEKLGYDTVFTENPMSSVVNFDYKQILSPFPKNNSQSTIKELKIIASATKNRSKQDIDLVYYIDQELDEPFIKLLKKYKLSYPQAYIDLFYDITKPILMNTKSYWNRPRPIQLAKLFNISIDVILTDTAHSGSYPSGHTVYSNLVANILKDYYPLINTKELDLLVLQTAQARVMQGVHYPSDNKASIQFSNYIFKELNPKLKKYKNEQI